MTVNLTPGIHLLNPSSTDLPTLTDGIVHLHAACILNDGTLATFLPPLSYSQLYEWWEERIADLSTGTRQIIVYVSDVDDRTSNPEISAPWKDEGRAWPVISTPLPQLPSGPSPPSPSTTRLEVAGVVTLSTTPSQTGPFRAVVEKLFVSPLHRRRGIARRIMAHLESVALDLGKWSLMLDTEVGSEAESVYPRLGWERLGVVRAYGISPRDGRLVDEVWFWKDLRKREV